MENAQLAIATTALAGLLKEFRNGNITDRRAEAEGMERHTQQLSNQWDQRFPGFPDRYFPFSYFTGELTRRVRDAHLKAIIAKLLRAYSDGTGTVVNQACVFGKHARDLALALERFSVIGADIDPTWNWIYKRLIPRRDPDNFQFVRDNVFSPALEVKPTAVVFFGACGAVSDGAIDYAIDSGSPYLMCRTCCHDNIGGNTTIVPRFTYLNLFFRFKNKGLRWLRKKRRCAGFYFSDKYSRDHYPRSQAARRVSDSAEFLAVSRNSVESDICRAIIDLDRFLHLVENGYSVMYKGELFVAERPG
jgi:hypothetical protein